MADDFPAQLEQIRSAVIGQETKRDVVAGKDEVTNFAPKTPGMGKKITLRKESNLNDYIELDYNPTEWPFELTPEYNDIEVEGSESALEWKSMGKREFTLACFFTDFGYHRKKQPTESVYNKLSWLELAASNPEYQIIDGKGITAPPIILLQKGAEAFRVVITKVEGRETMQDSLLIRPERAEVNISFREVRKPKPKEKMYRPG
jgi:hypothetical protein